MTSLAHDLAIEVLELPAVDRARILELLIASFEPQSPAQKAWLDVANQVLNHSDVTPEEK